MSMLLELQQAMHHSVIQHDSERVAGWLSDPSLHERLGIYRNTIFTGLTKVLRLSYPVVQRLVGAEFFDGAAEVFITEHPPRSAYLDHYGDKFPGFLRSFPPAASIAYLGDVAELEWAVNRALHAPDVKPLELAKLAAIAPIDQNSVSFVPHPSISLLLADHPVDDIWRAVLTSDDETLAKLDIEAGPVQLLVERRTTGVKVVRLNAPAGRFIADLCAGRPLQSALEQVADFEASAALAEHLAVGRFVAFALAAHEAVPASREVAT